MKRSMRKLRLTGTAALATILVFWLFGCESEPCVGDSCPSACVGADCSAGASGSGNISAGRYTPCSSDAACDVGSGFSCVEGNCLYACETHFDCAGVGLCHEFGEGRN